MTFTAPEAADLVKRVEANGSQMVMGHPFHHTNRAIEAQRSIAADELDDFRMISILMTTSTAHWPSATPTKAFTKQSPITHATTTRYE